MDRDQFQIGNVFCSDTQRCMSEFSFDIATKDWIYRGKNERFLPFWKTSEGIEEAKERDRKKKERMGI